MDCFCASKQIKWHHSPSRAPNFGGLWEAAVKSAKKLLKDSLETSLLTFEELTTVLTQVETVMNSSPLLPLETLPEDGVQPFTPSHFLMGKPTVSLPIEIPLPQASGMRRWNQLQKIVEGYWKRWSSEYLRYLTRIPKWFDTTRNFHVDDIVVCKDLPTQQPGRWPLARVTEIHPGSDGKVRVVTVSTGFKHYTRPSSKLALLYESSLTPAGEDVSASLKLGT